MSRDAHNKLVALLPTHQQKHAQPYKTRVDEHLDPDLRSNLCEGADHTRVLLQCVRLLRKLTGDNGPTEE